MAQIDPILGLIAIAILIILNGFFVAAEFAVVAVDRHAIEALAKEKDRRAVSTLLALKTLSFELSGAQLGITVTSLLVGFVIEAGVGAPLAGLLAGAGLVDASSSLAVAFTISLVVATTAQMVFGELLPKNLSIARPLGMALYTAPLMRMINKAWKPLVFFLNNSANRSVRLLGIEPQEELSGARSLEELQVLIRSSREAGGLREEEFSLLARSITFREKLASDALTPRVNVVGLASDATVTELHDLARESGRSRFPVFEGDMDNIVGIAHVKDGFALDPNERSTTPVTQVAHRPLIVPESKGLPSILAEMRREREQMVVVVDEFGGTAGVITLEDLLEEIVGEIEDEHDAAEEQASSPAPGISVVSGLLHPDEVRDQTGFEMPEGDYDTLAGFLLSLFDRLPQPGDQMAYSGWEFKVTEMDGRRIDHVLVVAPPPAEEEPE